MIWHTTGSGKSFSMVFLIGALRKRPELRNPTFLVQVDRTDLDDQLFQGLVAASSLVGTVHRAESVDQLRDLLRSDGGGVICSTIEKFQLKGKGDDREVEHPEVSRRSNIIIIADEAHRTQ